MTLQSLPNLIVWPGMANLTTAAMTAGAGGATIDAAGEYDGMVFCAQQDMTVSHIGWRLQSVAGSPTADVRIETLDTAGHPSTTLFGTNTNIVTGTLTAAWRVDALTAAATITKGQVFAVKFLYNSGTSFVMRATSGILRNNFPYIARSIGGAQSKNADQLVMALGSSSNTWYAAQALFPIATVANNTFNNTNSAARGNRFQVPFSCRVVGLVIQHGASVGDYNIILTDDSGTELSSSSTAFDGDLSRAVAGIPDYKFFDNAVTLSPGTWYRMAQEPTSATNVNEYVVDVATSDVLQAMPGGANFAYATRASGTWSNDTDSVCLMDLLIDQLDDGAGGAGGGAHIFGGTVVR